MRWGPTLFIGLALLPLPAAAQEDDRGYLTAFLEDNLSDAGRTITITGFTGALSSRATIQRLEIADDQGIWITLDDVVLDWSRSSLLSGEVSVDELSAATITLARLPALPKDSAMPAPEAAGFSLPELPVSVKIGKIEAAQIILGETVLGEPVEGRFEASLNLVGGEGDTALVLERTDGPVSRITLEAAFSNASGALTIDLQAVEEADGIAARMLDLPGRPSIDLTIAGTGTLADFAADVRLASDGVDRLSGPVTIADGDQGSTLFAAKLEGNLAPLFLPEYAAFLGDRVALDLTGGRWPSGRVVLDQLSLSARALALNGSLTVAGDGLPEAFNLTARLGTGDNVPVLLPLATDSPTRVRSAEILLAFDSTKDSGWRGKAVLDGLDRDGFALGKAELTGSGRIARTGGANTLGATFDFIADGLALDDVALQQALGQRLTGRALMFWREGSDVLNLPRLTLSGTDFSADANLKIAGLDKGLETQGKVTVQATDLARFAGISGLPLAGAAELRLEGTASQLTGGFDLALDMVAQGLRVGVDQVDRLTRGETRLTGSARRDQTGTLLRALDLTTPGLAVTGKGTLATTGNDLMLTVALADLASLDPGWGGSISADARLLGTLQAGTVTIAGTGRRLSIGQAEVDRLIAGETALNVTLTAKDGAFLLSQAQLQGPNLTAEVDGTPGTDQLQVTGRVRDLSLLAAGYPGPVTLSGNVTPLVGGTVVDLRILGPAAIDAQVEGRLTGLQADLSLRGTADAAVLNALADPLTLAGVLSADLSLRGPFALSSLAGRVTLSGGRIAYPYRGLSLSRTELVANLAQGRAQIAATSDLTAGGRLRLGGSVGLTAPFDAGLDLQLDSLALRDPELFETTVNGELRLTGPLLGRALLAGRIDLGETQLLVPTTGFASAADLEAISHVNDSAAVRATRARAGLGGAAAGRDGEKVSAPDWALNVVIDAPRRIFLRGRGLDAELGGSVTLGGTLRAISPNGGIELIRGRLDLLGKRLELSEARLVLEGDLIPYITASASNETDGVVSTITIEGPANAPEVIFSSQPELPEEEVLAWLLFGRGLDSISVLQAAELANAVAVLAGRGGTGIIAKLRKGFGVDDLDLSTADDGTTSVKAGKYLTENVYTGVEVDQNGQSKINLNLDLRKGVTIKGGFGSEGQSGIGIYLEGDY